MRGAIDESSNRGQRVTRKKELGKGRGGGVMMPITKNPRHDIYAQEQTPTKKTKHK